MGIDRSFYLLLTKAHYSRQVGKAPDDFRFVIKAPAVVTDALVLGEQGQGRQPNTAFLYPVLATQEFITPALAGLGDKVGVNRVGSWPPFGREQGWFYGAPAVVLR